MQVENQKRLVKLIMTDGGYLGTPRRRRTWRPTKSSGELAASDYPGVSEWVNPILQPVEYIDRYERT